jgi:hypothetical protein
LGFRSTYQFSDPIVSQAIAADADVPGQRAAEEVARRWRETGREVFTIAPPAGDWADSR